MRAHPPLAQLSSPYRGRRALALLACSGPLEGTHHGVEGESDARQPLDASILSNRDIAAVRGAQIGLDDPMLVFFSSRQCGLAPYKKQQPRFTRFGQRH